MAFLRCEKEGLVYLTSTILPVPHAFTTRLGGVSTGSLSSLNLGEHRGDAPENVRENYRRLGAALGFDPGKLCFTKQVHETEVVYACPEKRHVLFAEIPYQADGLVTDLPDQPILCFTADCVPVLLCDPVNGVIAAVHCGWRSSVGDILGRALEKMRTLGAAPEMTRAAIGPAIGPCCFETGTEVPAALEAWLGKADGADFYKPKPGSPGKFLVDLKGANGRRLERLGLRPAHIDISPDCTMCRPELFWSHRVTHGDRGSQAALIFLEKEPRHEH